MTNGFRPASPGVKHHWENTLQFPSASTRAVLALLCSSSVASLPFAARQALRTSGNIFSSPKGSRGWGGAVLLPHRRARRKEQRRRGKQALHSTSVLQNLCPPDQVPLQKMPKSTGGWAPSVALVPSPLSLTQSLLTLPDPSWHLHLHPEKSLC